MTSCLGKRQRHTRPVDMDSLGPTEMCRWLKVSRQYRSLWDAWCTKGIPDSLPANPLQIVESVFESIRAQCASMGDSSVSDVFEDIGALLQYCQKNAGEGSGELNPLHVLLHGIPERILVARRMLQSLWCNYRRQFDYLLELVYQQYWERDVAPYVSDVLQLWAQVLPELDQLLLVKAG